MLKDYDLIGSYNSQRYLNMDSERTVNLFEYIDQSNKKPKTLLGTSGLLNSGLIFAGATGGFRTTFVFNGYTYVVIGNSFFRIDPFNIVQFISNINTAIGYVGIEANTFQVIIVDGQDGWIYNTLTNTFTQITDSNFPASPIDVTYLDGFFVIASGGTNVFVLSQFNDGLSYTPLQQGAINSHPGTIVACRTLHRRLFLFSQNFTEVWENVGAGSNLPFRRNNSLLMEYGCAAIGSVTTGFDRMFFLSQDKDGLGAIMEVMGSEPVPVSTRALDFELAQYAADPNVGVSDARGILIKENGLIFYRLNFTNANHTWVLNITMSTRDDPNWHEEEILNGDRHPAQTHAYFNGINYYGHYALPIYYIVSSQYMTNDGEAIKRMRIGRPIVPEGYNRTRINRFQVDFRQGFVSDYISSIIGNPISTEIDQMITTESGDVITTEIGFILNSTNNPIVYLSYSKDGGNVYGNRLIGLMGKEGERSFRTVWRKLGVVPRGQAFVPKLEFFNEFPCVIMGAAWDFEVLPE